MNRKSVRVFSYILGICLLMAGIEEANAKRMGGGSSFGSRPSYSAPYQRSVSPTPSPMQQSNPSAQASRQQQAAAQNQAARQNWAGRGGLMGMLGGLALGGILGSLFFGGAFEGINFMDILLIVGLGYLLLKLFAAKAPQNQPVNSGYQRNTHAPVEPEYNETYGRTSNTGFETDVLFGKNKPLHNQANHTVPVGFDREAFMKGAESAYRYLQSAWDKADLAAIRGLTTDKVFAEIQDQLRASTTANKTEILQLTSELLDVQEVGNDWEASVLFEVSLRENDSPVEKISEVWHFIRSKHSQQPKWFLDGIQQVTE